MKPRLLDLFAGAGGCSVGYHRAGFDVVGVDIEAHPDYPFTLHVADAMTFPLDGFDVVHASPPCQAFTTMGNRYRESNRHVDLIAATRDRLETWGGLYVIENVLGARPLMRAPVILSGGMFGLGVHRPRLFETNAPVYPLPDRGVTEPIGVYGKNHDGRRLFDRTDGTIQYAAASLAEAQAAMGIDWMTWDDLREAIPPAYTEWIGLQLIDALAVAA